MFFVLDRIAAKTTLRSRRCACRVSHTCNAGTFVLSLYLGRPTHIFISLPELCCLFAQQTGVRSLQSRRYATRTCCSRMFCLGRYNHAFLFHLSIGVPTQYIVKHEIRRVIDLNASRPPVRQPPPAPRRLKGSYHTQCPCPKFGTGTRTTII